MNKVRQLLIFLERGASQRAIEREVGINRRTIVIYLEKFLHNKLGFHERFDWKIAGLRSCWV